MKILVDLLWGYHVIALIFLTGVRITFESSFVQIRKFGTMLKNILKKNHSNAQGISPFQALSTALAGSIGTGNIVGVGLAISMGGAGALFWMVVSAFFGMATVFAEVALAVKYSNDKVIGAFAYIEKIGIGKVLPFIYGVGCVLSCLAMGNMAQAKTVAEALGNIGVPNYITGVCLAIIMFLLTCKGVKTVGTIAEKLVPFMTIFFISISIIMLFMCRQNIPSAIKQIFESAFNFKAGLGGGIYLALKIGISRGVFTNEAGLGTSSMVFSSVKNKNPLELASLGMFQVFIDTIIMCSITGLCVICGTTSRSGEFLVLTAFNNILGQFGFLSINFSMLLFAFATMLATSFYGKIGLKYISKNEFANLFPYLFAISAFLGCILNIKEIFMFCDAFNGLMAIPNLIAIAYLWKRSTKVNNLYK